MTGAATWQDLGPCCACHKTGETVRNLIMMTQRAPVPGTGWGCFVCELPNDGALAILCDECIDGDKRALELILGYPDAKKRINRIMVVTGHFDHDKKLHRE